MVLFTCSQMPIFLQSLESQRLFYLGEFLAPGISMSFDMVHLSSVPDRFKNLYGLLEVFKGKVVGLAQQVMSTVYLNVSMCI